MQLRSVGIEPPHLIDDETGFELIEKDGIDRIERWVRTGEDSRRNGVIFVFRNFNWISSGGTSEVEFKAIGLSRMIEELGKLTGKLVKGEVIYGFDIPAKEFERSFQEYTGGNAEKLSIVRRFVSAAMLEWLRQTPNSIVNFR